MSVVGIYRIIGGEGGFPAVELNDQIISSGIDLRNEREAIDFMRASASERGWQLNIIRDGGHFDRAEAVVDLTSIRFPASTLRLVDAIASRVAALLRDGAAGRAAGQGRSKVGEDDVYGALPSVLDEIARQAGPETSNG